VHLGKLQNNSISGIYATHIKPNSSNNIVQLESFNKLQSMAVLNNDDNTGYANMEQKLDNDIYDFNPVTGLTTLMVNIVIENTSNANLKLYPLFYGENGTKLSKSKSSLFALNNYVFAGKDNNGDDKGVWIKYSEDETKMGINAEQMAPLAEGEETPTITSNYKWTPQLCNQFITFRINDLYNGNKFYAENPAPNNNGSYHDKDNILPGTQSAIASPVRNTATGILNKTPEMVIYPQITKKLDLCIDNDGVNSCFTIKPGELYTIPLCCQYNVKTVYGNTGDTPDITPMIQKTISFDLRNSLYAEPKNYKFTIMAKHAYTTEERIANEIRTWNEYVAVDPNVTWPDIDKLAGKN
jgi:hypothetical protein